jgi:CHAT domain-containing protein/tetratricopeptide (TPR) repeat protein
MSTYERLIATIRAFVEALSWDESRAVLERHPELMKPDVIAALETFAQNAERVGNAHMAHAFRIHRALLRRCAEVGPATAFLEMTGAGNDETEDDPDALIQELSDPRAPGGAARKIEVCERLIALFVPEDAVAEELWIGAHVTLAENLLNVAGDRTQNCERAVTVLERALVVADETRHPEGWAAAHAMLGVVLYERKAGDPAENIERGIRASELSMRVRTRAADPRAWAATANNLASAYLRRMSDDRAVDLEKAIGLLDAALAIRTRERTPEQWAASVFNLGSAYLERLLGDRAENVEQAISCYDDALSVWQQERDPARWAQVMNARGVAYAGRLRGEPAQNVETAIETFQAALTVRTRGGDPAGWAETTRNLANAYCLRQLDDRQQNVETAILAFEDVLDATPRAANPCEWAITQIGLGNACAGRAEDRAESLDRALAAYTAAAGVLGPGSLEWVATRIGMGNVHLERVRGGRMENLEEAIQHFQDGLGVATRARMPREWGKLQHGLLGAYAVRRSGDHVANLQEALSAADKALEVRTPAADPVGWTMTQQNVAPVLMDRDLPGDRSAHQERALAALTEALEIVSREAAPRRWAELRGTVGAICAQRLVGDRVANLRGAVAAFTDALEIYPAGSVAWAQAQRNLGTAFSDLSQLEREPELVDRAFAAFADALPVLRAAGRVLETRDTARARGHLAFRLERWRAAAAAYTIAMDAADVLYDASVRAAGKRSELDESVAIGQRAALAWGRAAAETSTSDDLERAIVAVERSRARWLGETLDQDHADLAAAERGGEVGLTAAARYRKAVAALRELQDADRRPLGASLPDPAVASAAEDVLTGELRDAQAELIAAIDAVRALGRPFAAFLTRPGFGTVGAALRPGQAIAYLLVTACGSAAFLVFRPQVGPPTVTSVQAELTTRELRAMLLTEDGSGGYLAGQSYAPAVMEAALATVLPALGQRLIAPIAAALRELGADAVTFVPCGLLGTLPLHAASYPSQGTTRRLIDEFDVSYCPSARVLASARSRLAAVSVDSAALAGVANPPSPQPLEYAEQELRAVSTLFDVARPLYGDAATPEALAEAAVGATFVHLACHGTFDVLAPLDSGLELADGRLSVRDVLEKRPFAGARLAVASACKSAVYDVKDLPDEVIGLPAGILCGGTPGVVGTLWSVDDRSTAILMTRFYAYQLKDDPTTGEPMPPGRALRQAQLWLSTATPADLDAILADVPDDRPRDIAPHDGSQLREHDYSDPYYWAPFVFLGI